MRVLVRALTVVAVGATAPVIAPAAAGEDAAPIVALVEIDEPRGLAEVAGAQIVAGAPDGDLVVRLHTTPSELDEIRSSPGIGRVQVEQTLVPALAASVPATGAPQMWESSGRGAGQVVAVVDSGVDSTHPALAGRIVHEACFVDDACPNGRNAMLGSGAGAPCGGGTSTTCRHGTQVAGVIAGDDPGSGLVGMAPAASIAAIRVFSGSTTSTTSLWRALTHLADVADQIGLDAVNVSIAGTSRIEGSCATSEPLLAEAVAALRSQGVAVVVASGNGGGRGALPVPACLPGVTPVAALDGQGNIWDRSDLSADVDVLAPGVGVRSTTPGGEARFTGTSAAAAHATGAYALVAARHPGLGVGERLDLLAIGTARGSSVGPIPTLDLSRTSMLRSTAPLRPFGSIDRIEPLSDGTVRVFGWAADANLDEAIAVHVYVDDVLRAFTVTDVWRPDVAAVHGVHLFTGFHVDVAVGSGEARLCAHGIDIGPRQANRRIDCRVVEARDQPPRGAFDRLLEVPGGHVAAGWAADPDHPDRAAWVHAYVDGVFVTAEPAKGSRPDVDAALGLGSEHGFFIGLRLPPGATELCMWAVGPGSPTGQRLGCRSLSGSGAT